MSNFPLRGAQLTPKNPKGPRSHRPWQPLPAGVGGVRALLRGLAACPPADASGWGRDRGTVLSQAGWGHSVGRSGRWRPPGTAQDLCLV